jgi:hypothetical protein
MKYIVDMLPLRLRNFIIYHIMAKGMTTFVGRNGETDETKKQD